MRCEVSEIVHGQFLEGLGQGDRLLERIYRKPIRFIFMAARHYLHPNREPQFDRGIEHPEKYKPGVYRGLLHKERLEQTRVVQEHREEEKYHTQMEDIEHRAAQDVLHLIMADLMRQHCHQFGHCMAGDQCIKESDTLVLPKASKKSIGLAGTP